MFGDEDVKIDFVPWICEDNQQEIKDFITATKSQICFGHFALTGFQESRDHVCENGMNREDLDVYDIVISGHFHHRSSDGHIFYVGSPGEMNWADYGDKRGFHIFDTVTRELEFIENPYHMFFKVIYDGKNETSETIESKNYEIYRSAYIKIIIDNKENMILFDRFIEKLYEINPTELIIMENFSQNTELSESDIIDQSDDTQTIISKYIDSTESNLDKNRLKGFVSDVYKEALGIEL
jgi:DNA repair exonuclease SbcCD nuclease subunit